MLVWHYLPEVLVISVDFIPFDHPISSVSFFPRGTFLSSSWGKEAGERMAAL